jgi:palmitoyltransferase ZDHHC13/17
MISKSPNEFYRRSDQQLTFNSHCPWINNCVGNNNLRHFVLYILFMEIGILVYIRLVLACKTRSILHNHRPTTVSLILIIDIESLPVPSPSQSQCNVLSPVLCNLILRDPWTIILSLWTCLQLIWVTMLLVVQFVQIARNQTTYENMRRHSHPQARIGSTVTAGLVSGSASLGPEGAGVMGSAGASSPHAAPTRRKEGFFAQWKKLLGLDAFMVTASDASSAGNRRRENSFSRGVITNCQDFWQDPAPYFGRRTIGDGMLGGEVVNYARIYDPPPRTMGPRGLRYQQVDGGEEVV